MTSACAQPQDPSIMNIMQTNSWYTVNINPTFSLEMRQAIMTAFDNWVNSPGNMSGITFSFTFSSVPVTWTDENGTVQGIPNAIQINQQDFGLYKGGDTMNWNGAAYMNLNSRITCPRLMTQVAAHEIGHQMGLTDCSNCCMGASVMGSMAANGTQQTLTNIGGGRDAPSPCDQQAANQRREEEDNGSDDTGSLGGGDPKLKESTTDSCYIRYTYECYWNGYVYTSCHVTSTQFLGCW